jgi:glucan phosphoethanolaminetransferase (alkaline phosphatase superfamily)
LRYEKKQSGFQDDYADLLTYFPYLCYNLSAMHQNGKQTVKPPSAYLFNSSTLIILGGVGCLVFFIIFVFLIAGLILDRFFDTKPLFTLIFIIGSAPAMFVTVLWVVKRAAQRLNPGSKDDTTTIQEA